MKYADDIRRYFQKSTLSTNREKHEAIFEKIQRAHEKTEATAPVFSGLNLGSKIMKSSITKVAAAAIIIIAALIGIYRITAPSIAWADVAEKLDKIHSYIYRQRESKTSGPQKEGFEFIGQDTEQIIYNSANYGRRTDSYKGGQLIFSIYALPQEKALINILHYSKEYIRHPLSYGQVDR
ncbi:MAG: hypothetical protein ACYTFW_16990, partial [Planctomycetota bacterium]